MLRIREARFRRSSFGMRNGRHWNGAFNRSIAVVAVAALTRDRRVVVAVVVTDGRALRRVKSRLAAFLVGRGHAGGGIHDRRLRQRRKRLQLGARTVPIRSLYRIQLPVRRLVRCQFSAMSSIIRLAERGPARLHGSDVEEARRRDSRFLGKTLRIVPPPSSSGDELLRLRRMLHAVAVEEESERGEHPERDNSDGDRNGDLLNRFWRLRGRRNRDRGAIGRRVRRLLLTLIRRLSIGELVEEGLIGSGK